MKLESIPEWLLTFGNPCVRQLLAITEVEKRLNELEKRVDFITDRLNHIDINVYMNSEHLNRIETILRELSEAAADIRRNV